MALLPLFVFASIYADFYITGWLARQYDNNLLAKASLLVTLTKEMENEIEFDFADEFMPEFDQSPLPEYFQLWTEGGQLFERSNSLGDDNLERKPMTDIGHVIEDVELLDGRAGRMIQIVFYPQIHIKSLRTPDRLAKQKKIILVLAKERETLNLVQFNVHTTLIVVLCAPMLVIGIILWVSIRSGMRPLIDTRDQIVKIDVDNLSVRLATRNLPVEIHDINEQFNALMNRLEDSFVREQQFSADVSHELRTPIAEIRSSAEVALRWPDDIQLGNESLQDILLTTRRMQHLVNNLFALAKCDDGKVVLETNQLELVELIRDSWKAVKESAENKALVSSFQPEGRFQICSSRYELQMILLNLFNNAVSYTPTHGSIVIEVQNSNRGIVFTISNATEFLDQGDLPRLFDRMWQKDVSRSSESHAGLGLALVKAYCRLLNLDIKVSLSAESIFSVELTGFVDAAIVDDVALRST
jgi:signal transduction histidine kinase